MTHSIATRTRWIWHLGKLIAVLTVAAVLATACGSGSPHGELGQNQQVLAQCDPSAAPASFVQIDGTGSSASDAILNERLSAIEEIVRETAICSGRLRVIVFSASSSATTALFDGPLKLEGATDNARLKRVPPLVEEVMAQIRKAYGPAVASLSNGGSDITAQYRLANEWISQLGGSYRLSLTILTDGFQNVGVDLGAQALTLQEAVALASTLPVPKLTGAVVVVAGLGRLVGPPAPSAVVEGLVAFFDALCDRIEAKRCVSVTDYAAASR